MSAGVQCVQSLLLCVIMPRPTATGACAEYGCKVAWLPKLYLFHVPMTATRSAPVAATAAHSADSADAVRVGVKKGLILAPT